MTDPRQFDTPHPEDANEGEYWRDRPVTGIIGPRAKTWSTAEGKYTDPTGRERAYRTDVGTRLLQPNVRLGEGESQKVMRLGDYVHNPEMFAAYPDLADVEVVLMPLARMGIRGGFDGKQLIVSSDLDDNQRLSTIIHEIQHAAAAREGGPRGGNLSGQASRKFIANALNGDARSARVIEQIAGPTWRAMPVEELVGKITPFLYHRSAGEAEARAAQRLHQKKAPSGSYAPESYDVPAVIEGPNLYDVPRAPIKFRRGEPRSSAPSLDTEVSSWPTEPVSRAEVRELALTDPELAAHLWRSGLVLDA